MKLRCWSCRSRVGGCEWCKGTGEVDASRLEAWARERQYLGTGHPDADRDGRERFVTFAAHVPPEFLPLLNEAFREQAGRKPKARTDIVYVALWEYLEKHLPEPPAAIESTASDVVVLPALGPGTSVHEAMAESGKPARDPLDSPGRRFGL